KMPDRSTAGSKSLWRHRAFSPNGGLPVARPLHGFRPVSVTPWQSHRSLGCLAGFLLTKHRPRRRPAGLHEASSTFGSRNRPPNWLLSSCGVRCFRPFPAAVRRPPSPNQPALNHFPDRPPFPQGRPDFSPLPGQPSVSKGGGGGPPERSRKPRASAGLGQCLGKIRGEIRLIRGSEESRELHGLASRHQGQPLRAEFFVLLPLKPDEGWIETPFGAL